MCQTAWVLGKLRHERGVLFCTPHNEQEHAHCVARRQAAVEESNLESEGVGHAFLSVWLQLIRVSLCHTPASSTGSTMAELTNCRLKVFEKLDSVLIVYRLFFPSVQQLFIQHLHRTRSQRNDFAIWEDVHRLYENTTPFYVRDLKHL